MRTPSLAVSFLSKVVARFVAKGVALAMAFVVIGVALAGCLADGGSEGDVAESTADLRAPRLRSLAITPRQATIGRGATQAFTATGTFSNGQRRDLTALVTWKSSNAPVATISNVPGSKGLAT